MFKEEVIIRIIDRIDNIYPNIIDRQFVKRNLEEILYDYEIKPVEKSLIVRNNILDKAFLFIASKRIDGLSNLTLQNYVRHLKDFHAKIGKNIEDINAMDIRIYLNAYAQTGVKKSSLSTKISVLKSFFAWLENEEYIIKNPMKKINNVKVDQSIREPLSAYEMELMRDACQTPRERCILEFLFATGSRLDEVVKLNKDDIDWVNMSVKVLGKGNKERTVYFNAKTKLHLKKYLLTRNDDCEALFVTERKPYRRLGRRSFQREIAKIAKLAGIKRSVFCHLLRHTMASTLAENGTDLITIQQLLGHEDLSTTQVYTKVSKKNVENEYRKCMGQ